MSNEIYLDANATCAVLPAAARAALDTMEAGFGNPSSSHAAGIRAKAVLDDARSRARRVTGAGAGRIMFTSGATEGIQTAVLSALCAVRERQLAGQPCGRLLVYGATEHKAVPESLAHWNRVLGTGLELAALPVDGDGRHRLDVLRALARDAAMVCTMAANNETGVVSDLGAIEAVLRETGSGALWMVDCVQALGKLQLDLAATRIDYAPFSGHKLCAPKGIGMLYVREGAPFTPLIVGGGQEAAQRSGTENMAGIAALGAVLEALEAGATFRSHAQLVVYRDRIAQALREALPGVVFNAGFAHALPTTINFSVPGLSSRDLLDLFDAAGVRVSAGSACSAAKAEPSYVLQAMDCPAWQAASAVRLSFGLDIDDEFVAAACERIAACGRALRVDPLALAPATGQPGVYQMSDGGRIGWLVFDAQAALCVTVDAPAAKAQAIAELVRARGYKVRAVLASDDDAAARAGCDALCAALAAGEVPFESGWPRDAASVALDDGITAPALRIGSQWLARVPRGDADCYLLGDAHGDTLPAAGVRFAFTGSAPESGCVDGMPLAALVNAGTILCRGREIAGAAPWTTAAALAQAGGAPAGLPAAQAGLRQPAPAEANHTPHLDPATLAHFMRRHPDALLVDVREACEHAAGPAVLHGHTAVNVPMSRLAEYAAAWLRGVPRPLVFVCRSGNRSSRAAELLQRIGYGQAWHAAGGMALAAN
jgi:cysteine sulfinate desulfinase/cysteine desulfurase-like protein/rhodanese-related sulfurtransferase